MTLIKFSVSNTTASQYKTKDTHIVISSEDNNFKIIKIYSVSNMARLSCNINEYPNKII